MPKNAETMFSLSGTIVQTLLAESVSRRGGIIHNFGPNTIFLRAGADPVTEPTASIVAFTALVVGQSYNLEYGGSHNQDEIRGATTTGGTARVSAVTSSGG